MYLCFLFQFKRKFLKPVWCNCILLLQPCFEPPKLRNQKDEKKELLSNMENGEDMYWVSSKIGQAVTSKSIKLLSFNIYIFVHKRKTKDKFLNEIKCVQNEKKRRKRKNKDLRIFILMVGTFPEPLESIEDFLLEEDSRALHVKLCVVGTNIENSSTAKPWQLRPEVSLSYWKIVICCIISTSYIYINNSMVFLLRFLLLPATQQLLLNLPFYLSQIT